MNGLKIIAISYTLVSLFGTLLIILLLLLDDVKYYRKIKTEGLGKNPKHQISPKHFSRKGQGWYIVLGSLPIINIYFLVKDYSRRE